MQDFLFISFFLGHQSGKEAGSLLAEYNLLETAINSPLNRHAWTEDIHFGVSLRLPIEDIRLNQLLERLHRDGVKSLYSCRSGIHQPRTRFSRLANQEDGHCGLIGGGVDYRQTYRFNDACHVCGSGADPLLPLIAELGKMGRKDIDHLIYEGHFIVSNRLATAIKGRGAYWYRVCAGKVTP